MPKSDEQKAVSVYMPLELYQQLMEFKNQENLRSDSQAINLLVGRCLNATSGNVAPTDRSKASYQRLSQLEEMISDIASRLKQVEGALVNNVPDTVESTLPDNVLVEEIVTVLDNVPDTVESTLPDNVLGNVLVKEIVTVPDNVPNNVPDTVESTLPDNVLGNVLVEEIVTVPDNVPNNVPDTVESTLPNNVPSNVLIESPKLVVCKLYKNNPNDSQTWRYWAGAKAGFVEDLSKAKTYTEKGSSKVINQLLEDELHKPTSRERISCRALEELKMLSEKLPVIC